MVIFNSYVKLPEGNWEGPTLYQDLRCTEERHCGHNWPCHVAPKRLRAPIACAKRRVLMSNHKPFNRRKNDIEWNSWMEIGWMIGIIEMTYRHTLLFEWKLIWNFTRFRCFASVWLFERGSLQDLSRPPKESPVLHSLCLDMNGCPVMLLQTQNMFSH